MNSSVIVTVHDDNEKDKTRKPRYNWLENILYVCVILVAWFISIRNTVELNRSTFTFLSDLSGNLKEISL